MPTRSQQPSRKMSNEQIISEALKKTMTEDQETSYPSSIRTLTAESNSIEIYQELCMVVAELEEYRSIAENIGAEKAVSEKEKAVSERDEAFRWKKQMLLVESKWDEQAVGKLLGIELGECIRANIEPKIIQLIQERDEARKIIAAALSILPCGHIPSHTPESIPDRIRELVDSWVSAERPRLPIPAGSGCRNKERSIMKLKSSEKAILKQLSQWENLVFDHQEDFEKEFCSDNELLGLWFGSEWVKIWYMHSEGIHYTNRLSMKNFLEFVEKYNEN